MKPNLNIAPRRTEAGPTGRFLHAPGARPLDGFTIQSGLGRGGFGEIYFAASDAGKEVALKLIRRNLDVELRGVRQCLNLKHPNLLDIYDIRQDDQGDTWIVMEYVAGGNLEELLARHPRGLPPDEALRWFRGIAAAVSYLHRQGIVHRDLKPANVFCEHGVVKVGDYGLSKFISTGPRSGQTESIGTVHYMAPEIAGGRYGREIDVYALGVMLYELLTGQVPFDGESTGEILMKHLTAKPDLTKLPGEFREIIGRALEKDPARRFPSAAEMLAALPSQQAPSDHQNQSPNQNSRRQTAAGSSPTNIFQAAADTTAKKAPTRWAGGWRPWRWTPPLEPKTPRQRAMELSGSMLIAAMVAAAASAAMMLIEGFRYAPTGPKPEQFAWLALSSTVGAWAVLIAAKFWEGVHGEALLRRLVLMVVGLGVGLIGWAFAAGLMAELPPASGYPLPPNYKLPPSFYAADGRPLALAFMAVFGTLFFVIRWWRMADPMRRKRISLIAVLLSAAAAGLVAAVWQFPQPWLPMTAVAMSVAVQLSAPWARGRRREERG